MQPPLVYENDRLIKKMLCEVGNQPVTVAKRLSFELPDPFRSAPCGTISSGFSYDKKRDEVSVTRSGSFNYGTTQAYASSLYLSVDGYLGGDRRGSVYPREKFIEEYLAYAALPDGPGLPDKVDRVSFKGYQCVRFYEFWKSTPAGIWNDEVKYWCWEQESGLNQPFYLEAGQRLAIGVSGIDLEKTLIMPVFESLKINPLSHSLIADLNSQIRSACALVKSRYDQNLRWGSDYPDKRLTLTRLHYCGYDVPLPDLQAPSR
ncbi:MULTISPECIES: hypothetical protein [unclassified Pseudomonas]|uniref:hypothetical protein n=1 Tax=unclassified Pseudomonas TaxID=196821 RepID=UPI0034CE0CBE